MHVRRLNKLIFSWDEEHPARRFLEAFVECRKRLVGLDSESDLVDQRFVTPDGQLTSFNTFVYEFLCFDVVLDGWLGNLPVITASESRQLAALPTMRAMMKCCQNAALRDGNSAILPHVERVFILLDLWEECIRARIARL